jgi:excisionase family DNA binding protein
MAAKTQTQLSKRLLSLTHVAVYLDRPVSSVRTLIWNGKLPYVQEGRKMYVDVRDLDLYIERAKTTML